MSEQTESEGRRLVELRVIDLRSELERRNLDKAGNKQVLIERLQKVLIEEGHNPDTHIFNEDRPTERRSFRPNSVDTEEEATPEQEVISVDTSETNGEEGLYLIEVDNDQSEDTEANVAENQVKEETYSEKDNMKPCEAATNTDDASASNEKKAPATSVPAKKEKSEAVKTDTIEGDEKNKTKSGTEDDMSKESKEDSGTTLDVLESSKEDSSTSEKVSGTDISVTSAVEEKSSTSTQKENKGVVSVGDRNLWITNISQNTRATELKQILSEHGKVIGAKVVINARLPGALCYGYVKMETVADADNCIAKLNNKELNGQVIKIEKVRPDHLNPLKKPAAGDTKKSEKDKKSEEVKETPKEKEKDKDSTKNVQPATEQSDKKEDAANKKDDAAATEEEKKEKARTSESKPEDRKRKGSAVKPNTAPRKARKRSISRERHATSNSTRPAVHRSSPPRRRVERNMLTFDKIKTERERERLREKERVLRERRREEVARQRDIEREYRQEALRLERERDKLKRERERLERERSDFMQIERERQKLEREKLELERLELQRAKIRMQEEEERRRHNPSGSSSSKRPGASYGNQRERSYEDRKRGVADRHFEEAPPPPRFDQPSSMKARTNSPPIKKFAAASSSSSKDYSKSNRLGSSSNYEKRDTTNYSSSKDRYDDRSNPAAPRISGSSKYESSSYSSNSGRDHRSGGGGGGGGGGAGSGGGGGGGGGNDLRNDPRVRDSGLQDARSSRYGNDRDRSPNIRNNERNNERRPVSDNKVEVLHRHGESNNGRYVDSAKESRYERSSGNSNWTNNAPKQFNSNNQQLSTKQWSGKETWRPESTNSQERWTSSSGVRSVAPFSNNSNLNMGGPSCPPPPGINNYVSERFDSYKGGMSSSMRKY